MNAIAVDFRTAKGWLRAEQAVDGVSLSYRPESGRPELWEATLVTSSEGDARAFLRELIRREVGTVPFEESLEGPLRLIAGVAKPGYHLFLT
jgi:hypothetical protein